MLYLLSINKIKTEDLCKIANVGAGDRSFPWAPLTYMLMQQPKQHLKCLIFVSIVFLNNCAALVQILF